MEVRDPIHGAIVLTNAEVAVADHPFVQRLRYVCQTGFSQLPFPGATHSRYSHSLGAMFLAGRAFDRAYRNWEFEHSQARDRFRQVVRVAALCHDVGHAPFSHCTEFAMPHLSSLGFDWADRRANHEDYTVAILLFSSLAERIAQWFPFTANHVAGLITPQIGVEDGFFLDGGYDHRGLLSQIITSELDVDRLDYLVRDAYYTGAKYGTVDVPWLISSLDATVKDSKVWLALNANAIYAFDDYLISRHHMFLMVYFHHKSVCYEEILKRFLQESDEWQIPSELDQYLQIDDSSFLQVLRQSSNEWARRLVEHRIYRRVVERHGTPEQVDLSAQEGRLVDAGIDVISANSTGTFSRYYEMKSRARTIYVADRWSGTTRPLTEASKVFERYAEARRIARLYVAPEQVAHANDVLGV
jgi:uncharacterized protein